MCRSKSTRGRSSGLLGPERRRQDHDVLHDRRTDQAQRGFDFPRRPGTDQRAGLQTRPEGGRLPGSGSFGIPPTVGRGQHPGRPADDQFHERVSERTTRKPDRRVPADQSAQKPWHPTFGRRTTTHRDRPAVAINPKFILLDEPFAGVDPIAVEDYRASWQP